MLHQAANKLKRSFTSTVLFRLMNSRKAHLYCVGTAKSGTHSIKAIFADQLRSYHEPESDRLIDIILDRAAGRIDDAALRRYVLKRDRRLWLDVDSSQLSFFLLDELVDLFPDARFILTIRNPYAWLDSFINHQLACGCSNKWSLMRDFRFRPDKNTHLRGELILKKKGLYTLDGYLSYWAHHNRTVIDSVPEDRLLIVRTDKISVYLQEMADFAGVYTNNLKPENSHVFRAKAKFNILDRVDSEFLKYKMKEHCSDLIARFFPEIQTKKDMLSSGT